VTIWEPARFAHPRFARVADLVARFAGERDWPSVPALDEMFAAELAQVGVRVIEEGKTRAQLAADGTIDPASLYEVRIVERGEIPTRPKNAHDLLNALVWAAFPHAKLALTRALASVQRERAAGRAKLPNTRSPAHDRLAMIDEGALLRVRSGAVTTQWIFGHAIYEHAYVGVFDVRAAAIDLEVDVAERAAIDRALAAADLQHVVRSGPGVAIE
jgi:hypothetical protein